MINKKSGVEQPLLAQFDQLGLGIVSFTVGCPFWGAVTLEELLGYDVWRWIFSPERNVFMEAFLVV